MKTVLPLSTCTQIYVHEIFFGQFKIIPSNHLFSLLLFKMTEALASSVDFS